MKWFQHQKKISTSLIDEMEKAKKKTIYSLMKYGSRGATIHVPFTSQQRRADIESSIERMSEPQGKGDLENALKIVATKMFPPLSSTTTSAVEQNKEDNFTPKTLIIFVERKEVTSSTNGKISDKAFEYARDLKQNRGVTILAVVMGEDDDVNDGSDDGGVKTSMADVERLVGKQGKVIVVKDTNKPTKNNNKPILDLPDILEKLKKKGLVFFFLIFLLLSSNSYKDDSKNSQFNLHYFIDW